MLWIHWGGHHQQEMPLNSVLQQHSCKKQQIETRFLHQITNPNLIFTRTIPGIVSWGQMWPQKWLGVGLGRVWHWYSHYRKKKRNKERELAALLQDFDPFLFPAASIPWPRSSHEALAPLLTLSQPPSPEGSHSLTAKVPSVAGNFASLSQGGEWIPPTGHHLELFSTELPLPKLSHQSKSLHLVVLRTKARARTSSWSSPLAAEAIREKPGPACGMYLHAPTLLPGKTKPPTSKHSLSFINSSLGGV